MGYGTSYKFLKSKPVKEENISNGNGGILATEIKTNHDSFAPKKASLRWVEIVVALLLAVVFGSFGVFIYGQINDVCKKTAANTQMLMDNKDLSSEQKRVLEKDIEHINKDLNEIKINVSEIKEDITEINKSLFQLSLEMKKSKR